MKIDKTKVVLAGGIAAATVPWVAAPPTAAATTFTVTNLDDSGPGSLRQAIIDANNTPDADTITFASGLTGTITLTSGHLEISDSVTITGPGAAALQVSGNDTSRIFYVYSPAANLTVTIEGLTLEHGSANRGGAIINLDEDLTVRDVVLRNNRATGHGGAIFADGFAMDFTMTDSVLTGNVSDSKGGAVYIEDTGGPLLFDRLTVTGNQALRGGGIYFYDPDGLVTVRDSTISGNTASAFGGGIAFYNNDQAETRFEGLTISGNTAPEGAGVSIDHAKHGLTISQSTISGNSATTAGGGIEFSDGGRGAAVAVRSSTITANTAPVGAGVNAAGGTVFVDRSIVADNSTTDLPAAALTATNSLFNVLPTLEPGSADNLAVASAALEPLADNGGLTWTHVPSATSSAIDAGGTAAADTVWDQRGQARVRNIIDIGAVETIPAPTNKVASTTEDTPLNVAAPGVLDPLALDQTPTLVTGPSSGSVVLYADGSYTYTPNQNFNGTDSFTFKYSGAHAPSGVATVSITVDPSNDAPVAVADTVTSDGSTSILIPVLANDSDVDGDPLTIVSVSGATQGTAVIEGTAIRYTPTAGASGTDTLTYMISDGSLFASATVAITITPPATTTTVAPTTTTTVAETTTTVDETTTTADTTTTTAMATSSISPGPSTTASGAVAPASTTPAAVAPTNTALARTGASTDRTFVAGVSTFFAGTVLTIFTRRRRNRTA